MVVFIHQDGSIPILVVGELLVVWLVIEFDLVQDFDR